MLRDKELLLFGDLKDHEILDDMSELIYEYEFGYDEEENGRYRALLFSIVHRLIKYASDYGFEGNLWHMYLAGILVDNENVYSAAAELKGEPDGSVNDIMLHDCGIFREMFEYDLDAIDENLAAGCISFIKDYKGTGFCGGRMDARVRDKINTLALMLAKSEDAAGFKDILTGFYKDFGVGKFGLNKAFYVERDKAGEIRLLPVSNVSDAVLDDLVGYETAKRKLIENTEAFIYGRPANNCLLFGDAGTGKSSMIKGLLNEYYDSGLRVIELYKHQFGDINDVLAAVRNRNYRFILCLDDLSFEESETEYKYLKALIEGGIGNMPENVLVYATSNRRHLVKETWSDRDDIRVDNGIHKSDTMQEKLSLAYRFGVTVYFPKPDKKEFNNIVKVLAERNGIDMPEDELLLEANKWELGHGGLSGRTARQFIDHISERKR
ncbi:MAG: ATP-binding protein [Lachnospiraceae bacterium]|nr:ATP-binding protein [Lachnospiraceae bacterium]